MIPSLPILPATSYSVLPTSYSPPPVSCFLLQPSLYPPQAS